MKKFISILLSSVLAFSLIGCVKKPPPSGGDNPVPEDPVPPIEEAVDYKTYGSYWMAQHDYKTMPITAYNSCPPQLSDFTHNYLTSEDTYKDYAKAGVNTMMGLYDYAGQYGNELIKALDYSLENNLSYLVAYSGAAGVNNESGPKSALSRIKYHDAFGGIMLSDEPGRIMFEQMDTARGIFKGIMPEDVSDKLWYVNLFPTYASEEQLYFRTPKSSDSLPAGGYNYSKYLDDYVNIYKPQMLSYDYYPIRGAFPDLSGGYFENMSIIREKALSVNIPFWVFLQTCSFTPGQRIPNQDEIKWLVNTSLAYGTKGIQYFTGVLPTNVGGGEQFSGAMFDRDGNKTVVYDYVKNANAQVSAVDEVLMCSLSKGVIFQGITPWSHSESRRLAVPVEGLITKYNELTEVTANHALVGCFDYKGASAFYVANNAIYKDVKTGLAASDTVTLNFSKSVKGYKITDGVKTDISGDSLVLELSAGNGALIVLDK